MLEYSTEVQAGRLVVACPKGRAKTTKAPRGPSRLKARREAAAACCNCTGAGPQKARDVPQVTFVTCARTIHASASQRSRLLF